MPRSLLVLNFRPDFHAVAEGEYHPATQIDRCVIHKPVEQLFVEIHWQPTHFIHTKYSLILFLPVFHHTIIFHEIQHNFLILMVRFISLKVMVYPLILPLQHSKIDIFPYLLSSYLLSTPYISFLFTRSWFHCYSEIDTIQRCNPNLITMHPLTNGLKSAFLHNKCTPFRVCIRGCRYTVPATEQTILFQNPVGNSRHQMYFYIYGLQPKNKFNHDHNFTLLFSTSSRNLSTSFFVSLDLP